LSDVWGSLRGYGRLGIRRRAATAALLEPAVLARIARDLFHARVVSAARTFPAYAEKVRAFRGRVPADDEGLSPAELPVWTREDQRALFAALSGPPVPGSFVHSTGGSTGVPMRFYVTRESYEWRTAVSDRGYSWAGGEEGRKSVYIWGTPVYPLRPAAALKAHVHHWAQRRTYFDSFDFGDDRKRLCCGLIGRLRPPVLAGYAGNLVELARYAAQNPGVLQWKARAAITAAEGLPPRGRDLIRAHVADEVFESYGSREFMLIAMECSAHGAFHTASDNVLVEVVDDAGRPVAPGVTGRILVTDLHNDANPFVRYEIGDLGALADPRERCPCGLPFPALLRIEGRTKETIRTPSGKLLTALFIPHLMKEFEWVEGYQVVQPDASRVTMTLVCRGELTPALTDPIAERLRPRLDPGMRVEFRKVERLQKTATGKTPIVVADGDPSLRSG
jgi:phenylacetate-CoA ligase